MSDYTTIGIHNYHISKDSHLKVGGAPRIAYHYTIEKDGTVYLVNDHESVVWHTKGENLHGLGILVLGNFDGHDYVSKSGAIPTTEQQASLEQLLNGLTKDLNLSKSEVYGHSKFGKPACPGFHLDNFINNYKGKA